MNSKKYELACQNLQQLIVTYVDHIVLDLISSYIDRYSYDIVMKQETKRPGISTIIYREFIAGGTAGDGGLCE